LQQNKIQGSAANTGVETGSLESIAICRNLLISRSSSDNFYDLSYPFAIRVIYIPFIEALKVVPVHFVKLLRECLIAFVNTDQPIPSILLDDYSAVYFCDIIRKFKVVGSRRAAG
jgi:hypothetical protein